VAKKTANKDYKVLKKRSGRYYIKKRCGGIINGEEKLKILLANKLVKAGLPKPKAAEAKADGAPATPAPTPAS
jgi:hypothetical protein